jgi:hypothetical protein
MSARLLGIAIYAQAPSPAAKLVLIALVDACDDEGRRIFPSVAKLARAAQCSARQVQRVLRAYCSAGLLRVVREASGRPGQATHYEMDVGVLRRLEAEGWEAVAGCVDVGEEDAAESCATPLPTPLPQGEREKGRGETGDTMSPVAGEAEQGRGVTSVTETGDMMCHPNPQEEPLNLRERARADAGRQAGAPAGAVELPSAEPSGTPTLDQFRKRWPTTVADDAIRVENAWAALSFADRRAAFEAVPAFLDEMKALKRAIPPAGFTYLAQRRWQGLEGRKAAMAATTTHLEIKPLGKDWWAVLLDRSERGQRIGMMLSMAAEGKSYWVTLSEFPASLRDRLKATPAGSAHAAAWMGWLKARGHRPPELKADAWVFLPEGEPAGMAGVGGVGVDGKEADLRGAAF